MKKVLASMSKFVFGVFAIAVLALLMSLTYGAMQRIFPDNFVNQIWGLVLFDIASMCWAVAFVFQAKSVTQYAAAGIGFVVGFLGTLVMVASEVMLSGQTLAQTNTQEIGKWMIYGFIVATALHAALIYIFHAGEPTISEQINVGVARGEIVTEAIRKATNELEVEKAMLADSIYKGIVDQVKRDLNIPILADPRMPLLPMQQYEQAIPFPTMDARADELQAKDPKDQARHDAHHKQPEDRAGYPDNYGPLWNSSTNITPTLDAYAWVCSKCEETNPPYTRTCKRCQEPRTNGSAVIAFSNIPPKQEDAKAKDTPFQSE